MADYERVLLVKQEVFVYRIPPRQSNRGYKAADWNLQNPDWTGRLRVVAKAGNCYIKLEDKAGDLFAQCPVEQYPGVAVEAVMDSSRYFVIRIQDDSGRNAFIGIGFADRSDSFDLNVALQDYFKSEQKSVELEQMEKERPALDLAFKEGQTISINIGNKPRTARPKPAGGGGIGILPPPPGSKIPTLAPPPASTNPVRGRASPVQPAANLVDATTNSNAVQPSNLNSLLDMGFDPCAAQTTEPTTGSANDWLQF